MKYYTVTTKERESLCAWGRGGALLEIFKRTIIKGAKHKGARNLMGIR